MKKFYILESIHSVSTFEYEVEANDEKQAKKMIRDGRAECLKYEVKPYQEFESEFEVKEVGLQVS